MSTPEVFELAIRKSPDLTSSLPSTRKSKTDRIWRSNHNASKPKSKFSFYSKAREPRKWSRPRPSLLFIKQSKYRYQSVHMSFNDTTKAGESQRRKAVSCSPFRLQRLLGPQAQYWSHVDARQWDVELLSRVSESQSPRNYKETGIVLTRSQIKRKVALQFRMKNAKTKNFKTKNNHQKRRVFMPWVLLFRTLQQM
jgi:hypothetical protein